MDGDENTYISNFIYIYYHKYTMRNLYNYTYCIAVLHFLGTILYADNDVCNNFLYSCS